MNLLAVTFVPIAVAFVFIELSSLIREPARRSFMALVLAGAGAVYISGGGLNIWEFVFAPLLVYCSFRGLTSYRWIGFGWLLHSAWDVVHHLYGHPIIPFFADFFSGVRRLRSGNRGLVFCGGTITERCAAAEIQQRAYDMRRGISE